MGNLIHTVNNNIHIRVLLDTQTFTQTYIGIINTAIQFTARLSILILVLHQLAFRELHLLQIIKPGHQLIDQLLPLFVRLNNFHKTSLISYKLIPRCTIVFA